MTPRPCEFCLDYCLGTCPDSLIEQEARIRAEDIFDYDPFEHLGVEW